MRIIFMGTPEFAVPVLNKLNESKHDIVAAISQPDREKDKKGNLIITAVKKRAQELNIPVYQFEKVSRDGVNILKTLRPDLIVTAAYGQMLSREILDIPIYGIFNVHASILPKYRGSSPIQSAILCGDEVTGITIMKTAEGMDTGDILNVEKVEIGIEDNSAALESKLSEIGGRLLLDTIEKLESGKLEPINQNDTEATHCKKIVKADGFIDFTQSVEKIVNMVRAYNPWPTAYFNHCGKILKIFSARSLNSKENSNNALLNQKSGSFKFGEVAYVSKNELIIACGSGMLSVKTIQAPGKKILPIDEFIRGYNIKTGEILND